MTDYNAAPMPGQYDFGNMQNQGAYYQNLYNQYQNMSGIPVVGGGGQQYQWAMDPQTGQLRPVEYNSQWNANSWQTSGQMPGGGPQYSDWGGLTDQPNFNMPGAYGGDPGQTWQNVDPYQTGTYQPGSQWGQGQYAMGSDVLQQGFQGYAPDSSLDPQRVIDASVAPLTYQRDVGFADAAARAGQSGFAMSTPYMEQLGQVEQRSLQDLDKITQEYLYNAAQFKANQDLQAQQGALGRSLSAYGTHSGYGHAGQIRDLNAADAAQAQAQALNAGGQMQDVNNQYNAWLNSGNWMMDQNRFNQDAWRMENQFGQDAWRLGNQYANSDYWAGVNQWGDPGQLASQVAGAFGPWGNAYQYPQQTPSSSWWQQASAPQVSQQNQAVL